MTLQDLLFEIDTHPWPVLAYFIGLPLLAWLGGRLHSPGWAYASPVRWLYTLVLYGTSVPGIIAAVALADTVAHGSLMQAGVFSVLLPLISMLATFGIVRRQADPDHVPGFRRMTAFMLLLVLTAAGVFLLMRTRIWIFFGGGIGTLLAAMAVLFLLLKWTFDRAFGAGR